MIRSLLDRPEATARAERATTASQGVSVVLISDGPTHRLLDSIRRTHGALERLEAPSELIVVGAPGETEEFRVAGEYRWVAGGPRYSDCLVAGFGACRFDRIITLDADAPFEPHYIPLLLRALGQGADVAIGSRYVRFAFADGGGFRTFFSRAFNRAVAAILDLPFRDVSSGFRAYRRRAVEGLEIEGRGVDALEEILVRVHAEGRRIVEVPVHHRPHARGRRFLARFGRGLRYLASLPRLWKLRNSVYSADYDERAFYSLIVPQRMWQRKRYRVIRGLIEGRGTILDVGCGSSMIAMSLPQSIGFDIQHKKLRYLRQLGLDLTRGSIRRLPFADDSFDEVICSQVIEHIPEEDFVVEEFTRVLKPGGLFILGTPDYAKRSWLITEWIYGKVMPGAYADEHITHYTQASLRELLERHGFEVERVEYIYLGELVIRARWKGPAAAPGLSRTISAASPGAERGRTPLSPSAPPGR